MDRKTKIAELREQIKSLQNDAAKDMEAIQNEVAAKIREGIELADATGLTFSLADTEIASQYDNGGLRYTPKMDDNSDDYDEYGYNQYGWRSSSSSC